MFPNKHFNHCPIQFHGLKATPPALLVLKAVLPIAPFTHHQAPETPEPMDISYLAEAASGHWRTWLASLENTADLTGFTVCSFLSQST